MQRDPQFASLFACHQTSCRPQAAARPFRGNRFVDNEVGTLTENVADLFPPVHQGNDERAAIDLGLTHTRNQLDGGQLVLAIDHDGVEVLGRQPDSRRR